MRPRSLLSRRGRRSRCNHGGRLRKSTGLLLQLLHLLHQSGNLSLNVLRPSLSSVSVLVLSILVTVLSAPNVLGSDIPSPLGEGITLSPTRAIWAKNRQMVSGTVDATSHSLLARSAQMTKHTAAQARDKIRNKATTTATCTTATSTTTLSIKGPVLLLLLLLLLLPQPL